MKTLITKYPYECIVIETGFKFIPTMIDYDNQQVWYQGSQSSVFGEWYSFDELKFEKINTFIELCNIK